MAPPAGVGRRGGRVSRRTPRRPIVRRYDAARRGVVIGLRPICGACRAACTLRERDSMKRKHLSLAIGCVLLSPAAWAQQAEPVEQQTQAAAPATQDSAEARTLDAVTVTARRRVESIQDVPVAVSAFSEDDLANLQASDVTGLQGAVPNHNLVQSRGSANSVTVFIRGTGLPDPLQPFDPAEGPYVNVGYTSRITRPTSPISHNHQMTEPPAP